MNAAAVEHIINSINSRKRPIISFLKKIEKNKDI